MESAFSLSRSLRVSNQGPRFSPCPFACHNELELGVVGPELLPPRPSLSFVVKEELESIEFARCFFGAGD